MLDSTFDLISQTASNSLFVFCFCNLIIIIILVGSKPGTNFDRQSQIPLSVVTSRSTNDRQGVNVRVHAYEEEAIESKLVSEVSNAHKALGNDCEAGSEAQSKPADNNDDNEDDDELRKRVEEFIEKVNREWKAEMLRSSPLVSK